MRQSGGLRRMRTMLESIQMLDLAIMRQGDADMTEAAKNVC